MFDYNAEYTTATSVTINGEAVTPVNGMVSTDLTDLAPPTTPSRSMSMSMSMEKNGPP